jgi:hypothetical protein
MTLAVTRKRLITLMLLKDIPRTRESTESRRAALTAKNTEARLDCLGNLKTKSPSSGSWGSDLAHAARAKGRGHSDYALPPLFVHDALIRQRLPAFTAPVAAAFVLAETDTRSGMPVIFVNDNS